MNEKLSLALKNGTLKPYDLEAAQVGDQVMNPYLGHLEVIATHGITVVFGEVGESQIHTFSQALEHSNYLLPLVWLGDAPVYLGDVLYHKNGKSQYVVQGASPGLLQVAPVSGGDPFTMTLIDGGSIPVDLPLVPDPALHRDQRPQGAQAGVQTPEAQDEVFRPASLVRGHCQLQVVGGRHRPERSQ